MCARDGCDVLLVGISPWDGLLSAMGGASVVVGDTSVSLASMLSSAGCRNVAVSEGLSDGALSALVCVAFCRTAT